MTEQEFIEKWRGKEKGMWVESPCTLYWARSYNMEPQTLLEMTLDYVAATVDSDRAPCCLYLAESVLSKNLGASGD